MSDHKIAYLAVVMAYAAMTLMFVLGNAIPDAVCTLAVSCAYGFLLFRVWRSKDPKLSIRRGSPGHSDSILRRLSLTALRRKLLKNSRQKL
jgi:hypothetical protein